MFLKRLTAMLILCLLCLPISAFAQATFSYDLVTAASQGYALTDVQVLDHRCVYQSLPICSGKSLFYPLAFWGILLSLLPFLVRLVYIGLELPKLPRPKR
ncbi:hypothetical protein ACFOD0_03775 [Shewanella intestini]|uniref:DUF2946 domain-containing protein n=1 Tax=Shewanella intestini TaxID=2017544 RepID=A0ABS5I3C1_9GAMM|nr:MULTISPECIES: hypothetical protein [Shewanella]MBR9728516.1 hypothetical protein [Shewanella intestini]MRG36335.1 hypothetical protein [Shewanella sp. XMDDZSB0408]